MLTELRRYAILPGHMDAMHARMRDMLLPLFAEHGIPTPRAIWENREESSTLNWVVDWPDFDTRLAGWASIAPHFAAARQAEGTPEFVTRTTLTIITPWTGHDPGFGADGTCETAWHISPRIGSGIAFATACQEGAFAAFRSAGATAVNACNFLFGPLPRAMVLLSWPDAKTRDAGMAMLREQKMATTLAETLSGDGDRYGDHGEWEAFDRASYLPH